MVNYIGLPSLQHMEESIEIVFNDLEEKISYKPMSVKGNRKLKSIQTTLARSNSLDVHLFIFPRKQSSLPLTLVDARLADTNPEDCTLILCEGESAKSLIVAELSSLGDDVGDKFGILPFRGNILNPSEATVGTIFRNAEIQDLICALGLYQTDYRGLWYLNDLKPM
ncbi:DNA topoisomerase 2 [Trifolium repens]|nr:DNA topoisomerase 2 [Trifolium repens]